MVVAIWSFMGSELARAKLLLWTVAKLALSLKSQNRIHHKWLWYGPRFLTEYRIYHRIPQRDFKLILVAM